MTPRKHLRCHRLRSALISLLACVWALASEAARAAPNIVVILADDLGYSDLGSYGGEIETPNLDRLAKQGVRFTHFYVTPRCSPTRAALLTGRYPHEVGVGHLNEAWGRPGYRGEIEPHAATLADLLAHTRYRTYMSGKWHLANNPRLDAQPSAEERQTWPHARGFDRFFGTIRGSGSFYDPASLTRDDRFVEPGEDFYYTDAISSEAVGFLEEHQARHPERPFFLYLAYTAPHWPLHAPAEDVERIAGRYDAGWDVLRQARHLRMVEMGLVRGDQALAPRHPAARPWERARHREWQARRMEVYAAMVERMDSGVGRVLESVEAAGELDDTLIVFLSDNGGAARELRGYNRLGAVILPIPRAARWGFGDNPGTLPGPADTYQTYGPGWASLSNTPFRLAKRATHEGGIASPLIAHWPAGLGARPGFLIHEPGHVVDLVPTFLEASGAAYPERFGGQVTQPLRGESLMPLLRGSTRRRGPMFWEHEGNRAVRDGRWKLVSDWPGEWELYDLESDRTELNDLASQDPERVETMAAMYDRFAADVGVEDWPWVSRVNRGLARGAAGLLALAALAVWRWRRRRKRRTDR